MNKMSDKEFKKLVDVTCFEEYDRHRGDYTSSLSMFYKITGEWPEHEYTIIHNKTIQSDGPGEKQYGSEMKNFNRIATHKKLIADGWIKRSMQYTDYYFKHTDLGIIIMVLEEVTATVTTNIDDIKYIDEIRRKCFVSRNVANVQEIGILTHDNSGYSTKYVEFDKVKVDIKKTYNDDIPLKKIYSFITDDKTGLALFYGKPGTGKTTFITHLVQHFNKKNFVLMDSDILSNISSKQLTSYFIDEEDTIFIIEDAEKLLSSRNTSYNPVIASFLNMSDGLLAKSIKCKFICTFNTDLTNIDQALTRRGRMRVKYEFKNLCAEKVHAINPKYNYDMPVADLFNDEENDFSKKETHKIGF